MVAAGKKDEPKNLIIPIAVHDIPAGRTLSLGDIQILALTPQQVAKSEFAGKAFMGNVQQLVGRTIMADHKKGDLFLPDQFYPEGMGPGVEETLRPGFRAVSIPIRNIQAVAGFARPGAIVDVFFRSMAHDGNPEMALTLLERVELLAVGQISFSGQKVSGEEGSVTVAVTPLQAKALKIVEGKGDLTLALRRAEDNMIIPVSHSSDAMTLEQLLGLPATRRQTKVEIYKGSNKQVVQFDEEALPVEERRRSNDLIQTPIAAEFPIDMNTSEVKRDFQRLNAKAGGGS